MKKINTIADLGAFVRDIRKGQGVSQGIARLADQAKKRYPSWVYDRIVEGIEQRLSLIGVLSDD